MKSFLKQLFVLLRDLAEITWLLLKLAWRYLRRWARAMATGWKRAMNALARGAESVHQGFERFKESIDVPEPTDERPPLIEQTPSSDEKEPHE